MCIQVKKKLRIAAVDYGRKRIGLAVSDATGEIALPFGMVPAGKNLAETAKNVLRALSSHLPEIKTFVVGLPLLLNGTVGEMGEEVKHFATLLGEQSEIEIKLIDERLSSKAVERVQIELGRKRAERKNSSDEMAATLILQTYLLQIKTLGKK
jgi:putative Holliday junction resolvase